MMQFEGKAFLITGGYGLLGSHITDRLLQAGASRVVLFDNGSVGSRAAVAHLADDPRVEMRQGDILRINELFDALDGVHGVFHTAFFITRPLSANVWAGMDVNVRGMMNVLQACAWRGVSKLVYSSSISVYGNTSEGEIAEDTPFQGHGVPPAAALYGSGKVLSEHLCAFFKERHGLDYVALRVSSVYGERQHGRGINVQPILDVYECVRDGQPIVVRADPEEVHDYIYAGDVARAQLMAMQNDASGISLNIAAGRSTNYAELIQAVLLACGTDGPAVFQDDPARLRSARVTNNRFSIERAREAIGWEPEVSLQEGVRRLIEWRRRQDARARPAA